MKKILSMLAIAVAAAACGQPQQLDEQEPLTVIFDTDLGNDVDDAIAMDLLYKYADEGKISILAEGITKDGLAPAEFMDILNNWYGHPDIPFGIILNGVDCETDAVNYAKAVNSLTDAEGKPLFKRTEGMDYSKLPQTHLMYRQLLSEAADKSVTLVVVGFSTNIFRLLESPADEYSSLTGKKLIAEKGRTLVMMAGCFDGSNPSEYNVWKDIPAAQKIVAQWPTDLVFAPFELGVQVCYPATSIENDFAWAEDHPVVEAYKAYLPMPYDRPCWDPAALVYAVEGDKWFGVSEPGKISISDGGTTTFEVCENGRHRYLTVTPEQAAALTDHIVEIVTRQL